MKDLNQALDLLNQVIEKSEIDDKIEASKPEWDRPLDGDGWITHHLKTVRELLEKHRDA